MEGNMNKTIYDHPKVVSHTLEGYINFVYNVEIYVHE